MSNLKYFSFIFFLLILSCGKSEKQVAESKDETDGSENLIVVSDAQFRNAAMVLGTLKNEPFAEVIRTTGVIDVPPQNRAVVSAFGGGYIKDLPIQIGSAVSKGERILTVENPEFINLQQQYVEIGEQLAYLKSEYERQQIMLDEKITSQKSFLKAESEYKSALARHLSLKKNLQMLNINPEAASRGEISYSAQIFSPIQGSVTAINAGRGSYVSPADQIVEIINTDEILLNLKVFEKELLHLKKDQEIFFTIPEISNKQFMGKTSLIGASVDSNTRMATVLGDIKKDEEYHFSDGMFVEAEIVVSEESQLALPESAIVEFEGENYVLQLQQHSDGVYHFLPKKVVVGKVFKGQVAILNAKDISDGKQLLIDGGFSLLREEGED